MAARAQERLFRALVAILEDAHVLTLDGEIVNVGVELEASLAASGALAAELLQLGKSCPELEPYVRLLEIGVRSCPDVLAGRQAGVAVLFPGGSTSLVEGVYRGTALSDHFNRRCAAIVADQVQRRLALDLDAQVTVLEIGAGTGGTSRFVLAALAEAGRRVRYVYSDVSPLFTVEGAEQFGARYPFAEFVTLDVEEDLVRQGISNVDIAFATNVFHARRDVRDTVANVKRSLRAGGLLLVNEATAVQSAATLTFGLTEGWWRFQDVELRLAGSPLLDAERWQAVLRQAGFTAVTAVGLPGRALGASRQCLLLGVSDGLTWTEVPSVSPPPATITSRRTFLGPVDQSDAEAHALAYVREVFTEVLSIPVEKLEDDVTLERFGVDSLMNLKIIKRFEDDLGKQPSTLLFEHMTLRKLAEHFLRTHRDVLERRAGAASPTPPPARSVECVFRPIAIADSTAS